MLITDILLNFAENYINQYFHFYFTKSRIMKIKHFLSIAAVSMLLAACAKTAAKDTAEITTDVP